MVRLFANVNAFIRNDVFYLYIVVIAIAILSARSFYIKAYLLGDHANFATDIRNVIKIGDRVIEPVEVKPMVWAIPSLSWQQSPAYKAANYYYFDYAEQKCDEKVIFILQKPDGERRFDIDLSKYD